ncbi:hypothetical protein HWV62_10200 [Athelia sp. TMB]|nr:hypothetical protein HWV62_10200 [Athelia sp. TMB]
MINRPIANSETSLLITTMSPASVLNVDLSWDHPEIVKQIPEPTVIRDGLTAVAASIRGAGYTYGFFPIGPNDAQAKDALVAQLREKQYDGVIIGFGVRGAPELTVFFEEAVNVIKDTLPTTKLLFNSSPLSSLDAVKRNFPL